MGKLIEIYKIAKAKNMLCRVGLNGNGDEKQLVIKKNELDKPILIVNRKMKVLYGRLEYVA